MGMQFLKGHFDIPTDNRPHDDMLGRDTGVGAQESLWLEAFLWAGDQLVSLFCVGDIRRHNCHWQLFNSPHMIRQASSHSG